MYGIAVKKEKNWDWYFRRLYTLALNHDKAGFCSLLDKALKRGMPIDYEENVFGGETCLQIAIAMARRANPDSNEIISYVLDRGATVDVNVILYACEHSADVSDENFKRIIEQVDNIDTITIEDWDLMNLLGRTYLWTGYDIAVPDSEEQQKRLASILSKAKLLLDAGYPLENIDELNFSSPWMIRGMREGNVEEIEKLRNDFKGALQLYKEQMYQQDHNKAEVYYDYEL